MSHAPAPSKLGSLLPLLWAGLFMLVGILVLVYLGRDTARLMNGPLGEVDLYPLLNTDQRIHQKDFQGKVTVLHFWGTWCGPCRVEFPSFVEAYDAYRGEDERVQFISVSCSPGAESNLDQLRSDTEKFLREFQTDMPTYCDPAMFTRGRVTRMLAAGGFAYPLTMVIDPDGIVREYWLGATNDLQQEVGSVIDKWKQKAEK